MAETFIVIWNKDRIELRRIPSEGVWSDDFPLIKAIPIERTTRMSRLTLKDSGEQFAEAIHNLILDIDLAIPCWFLLPQGWFHTIIINLPELPTPEEQLEHIYWELGVRYGEKIEEYRFLYFPVNESSIIKVIAVEGEIIDKIIEYMRLANLELTGISIELSCGESYSFERPIDLKEATPIDFQSRFEVSPTTRTTISPLATAAVLIIAVSVALYFLFSTTSTKKPSQPAVKPVKPPTPEVAVVPKTTSQPQPPTNVVTQQSSPAPTSLPKSASPLRILIDALPKDTKLLLATFSPSDLKLELLMKQNVDWVSHFKGQPLLSKVSAVGNYSTKEGKVVVLRLTETNWLGSGKRDSQVLENIAKSMGMQVKGRIAEGTFDKALSLIDTLYKASAGISKIYLAPSQDKWIVTVE